MQRRDRFIQDGVHELRTDLDQRFQDEQPLVHSRMRKFQSVRGRHQLSVKKQIKIEGPGSIPYGVGTNSTMLAFDLMQSSKQCVRFQDRVHQNRAIEKRPLIRPTHWRGFMKRACRDHIDTRHSIKTFDG